MFILACPKCLHVGYDLINMPILYKAIISRVLDPLQMANTPCKENTHEADTCPPTGPGNVTRCEEFVFKVKGIGFTLVLPGIWRHSHRYLIFIAFLKNLYAFNNTHLRGISETKHMVMNLLKRYHAYYSSGKQICNFFYTNISCTV